MKKEVILSNLDFKFSTHFFDKLQSDNYGRHMLTSIKCIEQKQKRLKINGELDDL